MIKKILFFLFVISLVYTHSFCQQPQQDSAKFYRDIETLSKKNKVTKFFHRLLFKSIAKPRILKPVPNPPKPKIGKKKKSGSKSIYFSNQQGKIIRDIFITTLDPFGYSVTDTSVKPRSFVQKSGNILHLKTQRLAIINLLLIKKNEPLDSLKVKESERLIRSQKYVREVIIIASSPGKKSDSVDLYIRVLDAWSILANVGASPQQIVVKVTERNFGGTGHQFENRYKWKYNTGKKYYESKYLVPNIKNTYVSAALNYIKDEQKFETTSLDFERPFYSAFTKWAWGSYFAWHKYSDSIPVNDSVKMFQNFKAVSQDYWIGRAYQVFKGLSENNRTTNLILSARYIHSHFKEKPEVDFDTLHTYSNDIFYLASAGISTRKYRQDKFIFNYGVTEDVPIGQAIGVTGGYRIKNNNAQWYGGVRISWGNYYRFGYFSTDFEYGTFINGSKFEQGTFFAELNYFTGLFEIGNWKFRQFIRPQITLGLSRQPLEHITLTNDYGIRGFTSDSTVGNHRLLILIQTQSYAPWNVLGFRFGPYLIYALGMLADEHQGFGKSRMYSQIGLGVLIKNEYLVLNTFQFSIAFYPLIPGAGVNIFKINRYKTYNYGYRDFDFSKPSMVNYQ